jgi:hypothetical protein
MVQSLFGLTPEQIQQARQLQQQQAINQQAQSFGMFGPLYAASRGLSQTGINALAQGLFPEAQDPALRRATTTQAIVDKYKGQNINDPSVLNSMALEFSNAGLPDLALQIGEQAVARKPKAEESVFAKINPSDYTQESLKAFIDSGATDRSLLVSVKQPEGGFKVTSQFLELIDPKDRARVVQAAQTNQPIPNDITYLTEKDNAGTEFERLIAGLPPEEQKRLKAQYLQSKVTQTMSPSLVPVALKEQGALDNIAFGASDISTALSNLKSGKLKLGLKDNFLNSLKTAAGKSDEGSRAFSQFNVALETLRNARLNLNVGVQTEGDALRAANEFLANFDRYDTQTATTQLERVYKKLETAYGSKQKALKNLYTTSGTPLPDSFFNPFPQMPTGKPTKSYTDDQLRAGFEKAKAKYPQWGKLGYEAYKKQMTGQ